MDARFVGMAMDQNHVNTLFEKLRTACAEQFGFNPSRVSSNMQYMGAVSAGKHRFRDTLSHAEIFLTVKPLRAELVERKLAVSSELDWPEAMRESYRKTDQEIRAYCDHEAQKKAYVRDSSLWKQHAAHLRSLFQDHPTYVPDGPTPREGAQQILRELERTSGVAFYEFTTQMGTTDLTQLAGYLLDPYFLELEAEMWQQVHAHPLYPRLVEKVAEKINAAFNTSRDDDSRAAIALAEQIVEALPRHLRKLNSPAIFAQRLIFEAQGHTG